MTFRIIISLLILLLSAPAFADTPKNHVNLPPPAFCPPSTINLCGINIAVPAMNYGNTATLQIPYPYEHDPFTVICAGFNNQSAAQQVLDAGSVTCTLLRCAAMNVKMCGTVDVPVEGGTFAGGTRDEVVPPDMLIDPQNGQASFRSKCVSDDDGNGVYAIDDDSGVSCNRFPCPDTVLTMCGMGVPVQGGAALGEILNMTMPPPFAPDPFTVQCVGSNAKAPVYQVTDSAAVTCDQLAQ